jgi:hypothetical protein
MVRQTNIKKVLQLIFLFAGLTCSSQDTLRLMTNEVIVVKIFEIDVSEIKYKKFANLDGPMYIITKSNVASITYPNNIVEFYGKPKPLIVKPAENVKTEKDSTEAVIQVKTEIKNTITVSDLLYQYQSQTLKNSYILHLTDGSRVSAKIIKVTEDKIIYRSSTFLNGPMYYCTIKEVVNVDQSGQ